MYSYSKEFLCSTPEVFTTTEAGIRPYRYHYNMITINRTLTEEGDPWIV